MAHDTKLFSPLRLRELELKNRIWMSPMCQYSSVDGHPTDWHFVHMGSRAVGGAGLLMVEATAVSPEGRISPDDSGIWADEHIASFKRITEFARARGAAIGVQLAHAGRKASTAIPWLGDGGLSIAQRGWQTVAPSAVAFKDNYPMPRELNHDELAQIIVDFEKATERALAAGFQVIELHAAHGYLLHEFLSPKSNQRTDEYGGSLENRMRFPLQVAAAVRRKWPAELPLFVRISATDWLDGAAELSAIAENRVMTNAAWNVDESIMLCEKLKALGIDLIDVSSGGLLADVKIPVGPSYQVPFSEKIRRHVRIATAAVGMLTDPVQIEALLVQQQADAVFMARELLRNPYWPMHAARVLGASLSKPSQYLRS